MKDELRSIPAQQQEAIREGTELNSQEPRLKDVAARRKEAERQQRIEELKSKSTSYQLIKAAKALDTWYIDPILGLIMPGLGDLIAGIAGIPALYFALFKMRSLPLALAVIYNLMIDMLIGLVPFLGDFADALFSRANKKNFELIVGYVEGDETVISRVRKNAALMFVAILILGVLIYWLYSAVAGLVSWIISLL